MERGGFHYHDAHGRCKCSVKEHVQHLLKSPIFSKLQRKKLQIRSVKDCYMSLEKVGKEVNRLKKHLQSQVRSVKHQSRSTKTLVLTN